MRVVGPFVREVLRATLAQRVTSLVTLLIVFGSAATVLATAGRSAGAEAAVLAEVDAAGTRSLSVYAQGEQPELASDLVARLADYDVVDAVSGFGPVTDVTAAAAPQGTRVAARAVYGNVAGVWTEGIRDAAGSGQAWVTLAAVEALGMEEQLGSVRYLDGSELLVTRVVELPAHLRSLDPVVLVPRDPGAREALTQLVVVARSPQDLPLVQALVLSALEDVPADGFRVESSQELAPPMSSAATTGRPSAAKMLKVRQAAKLSITSTATPLTASERISASGGNCCRDPVPSAGAGNCWRLPVPSRMMQSRNCSRGASVLASSVAEERAAQLSSTALGVTIRLLR